jgi:hypothetical protein
MEKLRNHDSKLRAEKGAALIIVIVLSAIGLGLMTTLIYLITTGTQVSGIQKRYKTAFEAGMGGKDIVLQVLSMKDRDITDINTFINTLDAAPGVSAVVTTPSGCTDVDGVAPVAPAGLQTKLRVSSVGGWSAGCSNSMTINPADNTTYDMRFELGTDPRYTVYAKIVDTVAGSEVAEDIGLKSSGVVASQADVIQVAGVPNLYTVEVQTENSDNPQEKAKLQILYQY